MDGFSNAWWPQVHIGPAGIVVGHAAWFAAAVLYVVVGLALCDLFAPAAPGRTGRRPTAISLAVGMFWPVYLAVVVLFLAAMLLAAGAVILHGLIFDDDRPGDADGAYPPDDPYDAWDV